MNSIKWEDIQIGDKLQYEEKYNIQAYVTIIGKRFIDDDTHTNYCEITFTIDKSFNNTIDSLVGTEMKVGKSLSEGKYLSNHMKFKERGSMFDYDKLD